MANEILLIPEESILEVIEIIRIGLQHTCVTEETEKQLLKWCEEEENYLLL